ncbi:tetratricopeptide repeat protein [Campylobacter geochelonis]|uniref:TPR repeat-containing protein n=1 Tax=Campylobacter geochelonis TaxID=1780362 RepID=A0A128EDE0_9BACT|nr:tetratricopeptide repeat protein [Campylobacter geochelonis]QKF70376.1 hypothetical protein CGEO_0034 [Campylobacter geochelonis]CZE46218.1 TPR repeat-containing protein [Campylobacter geochelonis]CZE46412.1 TPR repeat-containing protein [Campylobacter geochelonis]CZE50738.1 TPR repeat-containing protein [Campylobacter geochelonis]
MENFFIDYRDPIFGLIILISAALIVATASYVWGVFSKRDEKDRIERFIRKFDSSNGLSTKHKELLRSIDIGSESLGLLATVFSKSGDFEKAINVYLIALENVKDKKDKEFILTNLGKVYFQAGFLKKSEEIFLESLKLGPRNETSLKYLSVIYERLKLYQNELEVLDALKEQGVSTDESLAFVKSQIIANDANLSFDKKIKEIMTFSKDFDFVLRLVLELHLKHQEPLSKIRKFPNLASCIDIIWHLKEPVNLRDREFKALFYAKNLNNEFETSSFFEINAISAMRKSGFFEADLNFKYVCKECKNTLPTHFYRCPICYSLQSVEILPKIVRKDDEINMPF